MKKIFIILTGCLLLTMNAFALETKAAEEDLTTKNSFFEIKLGYGIGGTAPLPIPAEIRKINGFKPLFNFSVQALYNIGLSERWGILTGVRLERKGMTTEATVKNYGMSIMDDEGGVVSGRWTGDVTMSSDIMQLTIPVSASLNCSEKWRVHAGMYLGLAFKHEFYGEVCNGYLREGDPTGAKIEIDEKPQTFDFSEDMRNIQLGATAGCVFQFHKRFGAFADLNWGVNNIFVSDFETISFNLYPIYATLGVSYAFK